MLLVTGKGGVGKTSVAAATAVRAVADGARVLLSSTDPAHSLADALAVDLDDSPRAVAVPGEGAGTLLAQQLDTQARLEARWERVRDYLAAVLSWTGVGELTAEELVTFPGLDELFALLDLDEQLAYGDHDVVVVDCAPTAATLKLLAMPDALRWYAERGNGARRRLAQAAAPLTRPLGATGSAFPLPDDAVLDTVVGVHRQLASAHAWLTDTSTTSVRLVATPERLSVAETSRTLTTLSLFGYGIDALVVNRILPDEIRDPYLAGWKRHQAEQLEAARALVAPVPVLAAPLLRDEPIGVAPLQRLGEELYGTVAATELLHDSQPATLDLDAEPPRLTLRLPEVGRDQVELHRSGTELLVKVAGIRRTVPLPAALRHHEVAGAELADGALTVRFTDPDATVVGRAAASS
ncbi:MAG: ArsA family ATPase [Nitriliruptoraceae bacterium]